MCRRVEELVEEDEADGVKCASVSAAGRTRSSIKHPPHFYY